MKFLLNKLNSIENIIFDDVAKEIKVNNEKVERLPDKNIISMMFENLDYLIDNTPEIVVHKIEKNARLLISQNAIYEFNTKIGIMKIEIEINKLDKLSDNGGFFLIYTKNKENEIVYLAVRDNIDIEKKSFYHGKADNEKNNFFQTKNGKSNKFIQESDKQVNNNSKPIDIEYIEGVVRIPVQNTINNELIEGVKRVNDGNAQIYRSILQLSNKIEIISSEIVVKKEDESNKKKIEDLTNIIDGLTRDRIYLENEIEHSKSIAFNDLKSRLKFSIVAIDRQIDLDSFSTKNILDDLIDLLFIAFKKELTVKKLKNENEIDNVFTNVLKQEIISYTIRNIVDNIDSKVQSLQEIKRNFNSLKINEEAGE